MIFISQNNKIYENHIFKNTYHMNCHIQYEIRYENNKSRI